MNEKPANAIKPDAQPFDEIRISTVPRYKESGMSGDEWRISAKVDFYRKGKLICSEERLRNIETAVNFLPYLLATAIDNGNAHFAGEPGICDQEGCSNQSTVFYRLKKHYCSHGNKPEFPRNEFRKFCETHKVRGDCGLEDSDANYEPFKVAK